MKDRADPDFASAKAVAELHRVVEAVDAEISARCRAIPDDAATAKSNSRFISAKSARLSQAAGIARAGGRQLAAARSHILDAVSRAESAGFTVQEDFTVVASAPRRALSAEDAQIHSATIQAAVTKFEALDGQLTSRLCAVSKDLQDLRDT
jgi:hypothetical protein